MKSSMGPRPPNPALNPSALARRGLTPVFGGWVDIFEGECKMRP
jgi:hypothetical protein